MPAIEQTIADVNVRSHTFHFRHSGNDRRFEDSERLQCLPRRQIDSMGHGCPKDMGGPLTWRVAE